MEMCGNILKERTGLMLPVIYTFTCGQKDTRANIGRTFDLPSSLNFEKNGGIRLLGNVR